MDSDVMAFDEAVAFLKTSKPTLYRWLRDGRIKAHKAGREWRFYREDLIGFIEADATGLDSLKAQLLKAIAFYEKRLKVKGIHLDINDSKEE